MALLDQAVRLLWAALKYQGTFPTRGDVAARSERPLEKAPLALRSQPGGGSGTHLAR